MATGDVVLALVGDMFVQRPEPESIFASAAPVLRAADITFGNLEGPVTDVGEVPETKRVMHLQIHSEERNLAAYTSAGFDAVGLANNHGMNMGASGLLRCIEVLDEVGIGHAGGGANIGEARRPAIVERKGTRVAFLSYTSVFAPPFAATADRPGMATVRVSTSYEPQPRHMEVPGSPPIIHTHPDPKDTAAMVEDVLGAKEQADLVVISWHWGLSGATGGASAGHILPYQVELAHAAIDAGAGLIIGHHPHRLEGIEVYRGKVIFYSLGNFAFEVHSGSRQQTIIARCVTNGGEVQRVSFLPTYIDEQSQPVPVSPDEGSEIIRGLEEMSAAFETRFRVDGEEVVIEARAPVAVG